MRYYVFSVETNKEGVENRSQPKAYDTRNEAVRQYHKTLSEDMGNSNIATAIVMVINSAMGVEVSEKYVADVEPQTEPTE